MNSRFAENIPIHCVPIAELKAANERLIEVFVVADTTARPDEMVRFKSTSLDLYAVSNHARMNVHYGIRCEKEDKSENK